MYAVTSSAAVGLGLRKMYEKVEMKLVEPLKMATKISVPYVAVATAGVINLLIMRENEKKGLPVKDESGALIVFNTETK